MVAGADAGAACVQRLDAAATRTEAAMKFRDSKEEPRFPI